MTKYLLLVVLCVSVIPAYAMDGNAVLQRCQVVEKTELMENDMTMLQWCFGYIEGVIDDNNTWQGLMAHEKNHTHDKLNFCFPDEGIVYAQLARVVVKYLRDHPENLHWNGSALVHNALSKAFRCS